MTIIEPEPNYHAGGLLVRIFFDPWIAMLAIGALGHQINQPFLYNLGYWNFVLICIALQALSPIASIGKYRVVEKDK